MIIFVKSMNKLFLALLSGLLLAFSWPSIGVFPLVFIAFIPLFILEKKSEKSKQVFWYSFFAFFIFNAITTYWVYHATLFGAIAAFFVNATLMATAFWVFHKIKKATSNRLGYFSFIVLWISMEYLHLNWDLSWPWLTLGNAFANSPSVVQWYEFTGFLVDKANGLILTNAHVSGSSPAINEINFKNRKPVSAKPDNLGVGMYDLKATGSKVLQEPPHIYCVVLEDDIFSSSSIHS